MGIIIKLFSPGLLLFYLFASLLFCEGLMYFLLPTEKLIILSTVFALNVLVPIFLKPLSRSTKVVYVLSVSFLLVLSTYILSYYIYYPIVTSIYIISVLVFTLRYAINVDYQVMAMAALASYMYYLFYAQICYCAVPFTIIILAIGAVSAIRLYHKKTSPKNILLGLVLGVLSTLFVFF